MNCKKACLIVDLREGQEMAKITDMIAVLSAAGWKTEIALKEYGGESMKLASKAAKEGYDLVIAYGGDGTLNQVVNGVMNVAGKSIVGVIPGGTANEWAGEISLPGDHVKAALALVNSNARSVDLGHVEAAGLTFPGSAQSDQQPSGGKKSDKKKKASSKTKHHFLLMAGLGIDAAVIAHTSKSLKYHVGRIAFDIAAAKELPTQHPFPVEIRASGIGGGPDITWRGEALQVIVANTRRYANVVKIAPDAYLDDGLLEVCVITGSNPLSTIEQVASLLLRREPDHAASRFFRGAHLSIRVPASIKMHLDGSAVELQDYLSKSDRESLQQVEEANSVMVNYQFDAEPHALRMAIPRTYDNALFQHASQDKVQQWKSGGAAQANNQQPGEVQNTSVENIETFMKDGDKVTVIGAVAHPEKRQTYIIAGNMYVKDKGETEPVAVRVDSDAAAINAEGQHVSPAQMEALQEGAEIVVEGRKNKRGVIRATHVVV